MQGNARLRPSGARAAQIDALVEKGVQGIILSGMGGGDTTDAALAELEKAAKKGVTVVHCSRTGGGVGGPQRRGNDDKFGFIAGMELNAQKRVFS